jgi:hypothetical protein
MTTKKDLPAPRLKELFLTYLASDDAAGNISHAVKLMLEKEGQERAISRPWVYLERARDQEFDKEIKKIQAESIELIADEAEANLRRIATAGNATANIFILKNLRSDKWRDRQEHTGEGGKPIEVNTPGLDGWLHANIARMAKHAEANQKSS